MGWSFRKSVGFGPFRFNISKSGIGYSVGTLGFRAGVNASGRKYKSVSIPGTGLRYTAGGKSGCFGGLLLLSAMLATSVGVLIFWRT